MKTIKKAVVLGLTLGISTFSFSQLNLGVSSATQAAVKATANTTAITKTTTAATQAAGASVKAASATALDAKAKAADIVDAKTTEAASTVLTAKENVLNNVNANARAGVAVSSQNNTVATVGNNAAQTALTGETGVNATAVQPSVKAEIKAETKTATSTRVNQ